MANRFLGFEFIEVCGLRVGVQGGTGPFVFRLDGSATRY